MEQNGHEQAGEEDQSAPGEAPKAGQTKGNAHHSAGAAVHQIGGEDTAEGSSQSVLYIGQDVDVILAYSKTDTSGKTVDCTIDEVGKCRATPQVEENGRFADLFHKGGDEDSQSGKCDPI